MKRFYLIITILFVGVSALWSQHANVIWNTPSRNSSESMPCGGGDIGMNIWVEDGDVIFLSLIHISEPTRHRSISYAVLCVKRGGGG
uniref:DUF5703 domain-containing protein n=1 Tax=Bacteroides ovatus TaxID=28116 RepID=UPI0032EFBB04